MIISGVFVIGVDSNTVMIYGVSMRVLFFATESVIVLFNVNEHVVLGCITNPFRFVSSISSLDI